MTEPTPKATGLNTLPYAGRAPWTAASAPLLIVGPAYAGKSEIAMQCLGPDRPALVIGTADKGEKAFARRIAELKSMRPAPWETVEVNRDVPALVAESVPKYQQILIDSVSQWLAALLVEGAGYPSVDMLEEFLDAQVGELIGLIKAHSAVRFVLVSGEVGAGPAPQRSVERAYRRAVGRANTRLAQISATVVQVTTGIPQVLKG